MEELRDANGLTEKEFLAAYKQKNYPKPSLTADIAIFRASQEAAERPAGAVQGDELPAGAEGDSATPKPDVAVQGCASASDEESGARESQAGALGSGAAEFELLLIRRGGHPYLGCWALPGGFVGPNESCDEAARRELAEETGLSNVPLEQLGLYSTPGRDPRAWTASGAHIGVVPPDCVACAGDDAADARWFKVLVSRVGLLDDQPLQGDGAVQSRAAISAQADAGLFADSALPASSANHAFRLEFALASENSAAGGADSPAAVRLGSETASSSASSSVNQNLFVEFEALPHRFGLPRARVLRSEGFAFDHAQIIADAYLALTSN